MGIRLLDNIEFKGNKLNVILKWVIGVAGTAIIGAFTIGTLKTNVINRLSNVETTQTEMRKEMIDGFNELNNKIDAMYDAGLQGFEEYRIFNNKQLEMIIEFGQSNESVNQELLKRMLAMNSEEKARQIETQINAVRSQRGEVEFIPIVEGDENAYSMGVVTDVATGLSTYYIGGGEKNILDTLNTAKYEIIEVKPSEKHQGFYDITYKDKSKEK